MTNVNSSDDQTQPNRYARQTGFAPFGESGQRLLQRGRVLIVGCGALGGSVAEILVRSGVGRDRGGVTLVDSDIVQLSNLHRQTLFTEADARRGRLKVEAARHALLAADESANVEIVTEYFDDRLTPMVANFDVLVDATDNFATRFLLNRTAVQYRKPLVTAGVAGASGQTLTVLPGETACLECFLQPGDGAAETVSVLPPLPQLFAALEAMETLKILAGHFEAANRSLLAVDLWENRFRRMEISRNENCPVCGDIETIGSASRDIWHSPLPPGEG